MAKNKRKSDNLYQKNLVLGKKPDGTYYRKTVYAKQGASWIKKSLLSQIS